MSNIVIRPYQAGDEHGMCKSHVRSIEQICGKDHSPEEIRAWTGKKNPEGYVFSMEKRKERFNVLEINGEIKGFAGWFPGEVYGFYLDPDAAGKGYGRQLFEYTEQQMQQQFPGFMCTIISTVTSKGFYERMGFTVIEPTIVGFNYEGKKHHIDAWRMVKQYPQEQAA